jgi:hypothetical protein
MKEKKLKNAYGMHGLNKKRKEEGPVKADRVKEKRKEKKKKKKKKKRKEKQK